MAISLSKGGNISLTKTDPGLTKAIVGLGWDVRSTSGDAFDLDAAALMLDASGKVLNEGAGSFIFYNQPADVMGADGKADEATASVIHTGDNRTGEGDGDDEQIVINLDRVAPEVDKIVISVSIHDGNTRGQSFGQVRNAYVHLMNAGSNEEIVRYDLTEDYSTETALNFAEVYRSGAEWKFRAVGQGYNTGLAGLAGDFGVNLG